MDSWWRGFAAGTNFMGGLVIFGVAIYAAVSGR